MEGVLASFAQFDNDVRSDRTRAGGVRGKRGDFEPLIGEDLFERVQAVLADRIPSTAPELRSHRDFPFRNFVRCSVCGCGLTGSGSKRAATIPYVCHDCRAWRRECDTATVARYRKCRFENAQPDPDFRYFSNAIARGSSANSMVTTTRQGAPDAVCGERRSLCARSRSWTLDVSPV